MELKLNCDMGEGFGNYSLGLDEEVMPYIQMANLACGFHASDPVTMHKSVKLCKEHNIEIGCHPSYPDLVGFGRREMQCSTEEVVSLVLYQLGALSAICQSYDLKVSYLKPHGALYNTMMKNEEVFKSIAKAVAKFDTKIKLMILSTANNEKYAEIAQRYNISLLYEVFADRAYTDEGLLVPRSEKNAVISNKDEVKKRAKKLMTKGFFKSINGKKLKLKADALCVHGDTKSALKLVKSLHKLKNEI